MIARAAKDQSPRTIILLKLQRPAMLPTTLILSLLLLCSGGSLLPAGALPSGGKLSAYDVLQSYNLPVGLLPKGVLGYSLDPATGKFEARLNGTCSFSLESYQLRYRSSITGRISENRLRDLKGVSVKVLLFWINIVGVTRTGDELEFSVGIASADFSVDNFLESPQCGCGLDCLARPSSAEGNPRVKLVGIASS